jgi:hypothetical protein
LYDAEPHSSVRQRTNALSCEAERAASLRSGELDHEVLRETLVVTLYSLKRRFGCHAIKVGEFGIKEDALTTQDEARADYLGSRAGRRFARTPQRRLVTGLVVSAASNNRRNLCSNSSTAFPKAPHLVVGFPGQRAASTSGEVRLTGTLITGDWRQQVTFMTRGRDTTANYGGEDVVDFGPTTIGTIVQVPEPDFTYSARAIDRAELWSIGAAYRVDWKSLGVLEMGIQREDYRETDVSPGTAESGVSARPFRAYANSAFAVTPQLTLYAGYTQGLENSGVAPNYAQNSGTVLPASLTWQVDSGARYAVTPKLKIIAGVFELQEPYFNLDTNNIDRELGAQQARGIELSVAGEVTENLHVNVGVLDGRVGINGTNLAAEGVGSVAVGQPRIMYVATANYDLPW